MPLYIGGFIILSYDAIINDRWWLFDRLDWFGEWLTYSIEYGVAISVFAMAICLMIRALDHPWNHAGLIVGILTLWLPQGVIVSFILFGIIMIPLISEYLRRSLHTE